MMRSLLASAAVAALFLCTSTSAQSVNATVNGTVTDVTGALLQAVTVTATNLETGVITTTHTNETGIYNFPSLQPGTYKLSASQPGFLTQPYTDLKFTAQPYLIRFTLPLASVVTPGVEIQAMSMDAMMAASSASVGFVLSEAMVRDLPTVGNDALSLVRMLPGVNVDGGGMMSAASLFTFAGIPQISINTTRDGISVSDGRFNTGANAGTLINQDLVGEIRLILAPVDAELGRGNGQVQIQTRSGTNRYAGSAVWNARNSALDANTWGNNNHIDSLTRQWSPSSPTWVNNHQYTLSYGGPIIRNKTFFFALWDQQLNSQRQLISASVMTNTARQGIFRYFEGWNPGNVLTPTNAASPIIASVDLAGNPVTPRTNPNGTAYAGVLRCFSVFGNVKFDGTPFTAADCPGGTALTSAVPWDSRRPTSDPTGYIRRILDKMPVPNDFAAGDGLNLASFQWARHLHGTSANDVIGTEPINTPRKQINLKIDENFNPRQRLSVNWSYERNDVQYIPGLWPSELSYRLKRHPQVLTASFTSLMSPNVLNEARFGLRRQNTVEAPPWEAEESREEAMRYTIPGNNGYSGLISPGAGLYAFGGTANGVMNVAPTGYSDGSAALYTYADTLNWTVRKHTFRVGAELRFSSSNAFSMGLAFPQPRVSGGAGQNPASSLVNQNSSLPGLPQTSRTDVSNMLYFLAGSVNTASMAYWIDNPRNVTDGKWEDTLTKGKNYVDNREKEWAVFWKDDWKVTRDLTLNLGLRYEYYGSFYVDSGATVTPVGQGDGLWGAFRSGGGNPFERWLSPGNVYLTGYGPNVSADNALKCAPPGCDPSTLTTLEFVGPHSPNPGKRLLPADRNNFGPAVGFAWRFPWLGEGKTTVRGGYQITYGGSFGATGVPGLTLNLITSNSPGWSSVATTNLSEFSGQYLDLRSVPLLVPVRPNPAKPGQQTDIFASSAPFRAFDARYVTPYTQNFNLSVTQALLPTLSLDLRYMGTVSRKHPGILSLNTPNVYHNKELLEALEITRAGGNALLFDQMFAGLNLTGGAAGYGAVGTVVNGVLQTGSAHLRRNATIAPPLANGNFSQVATLLNGSTIAATGLQPLPAGLTGVGARLLRNGCDRLAAGQTIVGPGNPAPTRCFPENYIRANPQASEMINLYSNTASSSYHSMQAQIMLRPTRGFTTMGTYTWSKNLGIPGNATLFNGVNRPDYTDPSDRRADYTTTNSHRAHDFRGSGTFQLPAGPGRLLFGNSSGWLARVVEGLQSSIILTMTSGGRADISSSVSGLATGLYGSSVPDRVGPWPSRGQVRWNGDNNPAGTFHGGSYFDSTSTFIKVPDPQCAGVTTTDNNLRNSCSLTAIALRNADGTLGPIVLQNPTPGTRGNLGQRKIELPGTWSLDANLAKTLRVSESGWIKSLQLRMDATNVLNHPSPALPDLNINSSSPFGIISSKDGARALQGQLRVNF